MRGSDPGRNIARLQTVAAGIDPPLAVGRRGPAFEEITGSDSVARSGFYVAVLLGMVSLAMAIAALVGGLMLMVRLRMREFGLARQVRGGSKEVTDQTTSLYSEPT